VVLGVTLKGFRSSEGGLRPDHFAEFLAHFVVVLGAYLGTCSAVDFVAWFGSFREAYREEDLAVNPAPYPDASLAYEPCEVMRDTKVVNCLSPAEPCHSPFRC